MSRSRAREQGEKTNQTLHPERAGIIKTFHTGETKGRGAWGARLCARICAWSRRIIRLYVDTFILNVRISDIPFLPA